MTALKREQHAHQDRLDSKEKDMSSLRAQLDKQRVFARGGKDDEDGTGPANRYAASSVRKGGARERKEWTALVSDLRSERSEIKHKMDGVASLPIMRKAMLDAEAALDGLPAFPETLATSRELVLVRFSKAAVRDAQAEARRRARHQSRSNGGQGGQEEEDQRWHRADDRSMIVIVF